MTETIKWIGRVLILVVLYIILIPLHSICMAFDTITDLIFDFEWKVLDLVRDWRDELDIR